MSRKTYKIKLMPTTVSSRGENRHVVSEIDVGEKWKKGECKESKRGESVLPPLLFS